MQRSYELSRLFAMALACAAAVLYVLPGRAQSQVRPSEVRPSGDDPWTVQWLPDGLLYQSYVAGQKEPRLAGVFLHDRGGPTYLDAALGRRIGLVRYGSGGAQGRRGWQLDIEAAAFPRLNLTEIRQAFESVDLRFGVPLTARLGPVAVKFGFYHISAHVGDEFLERNPGFVRANYVRDSWVSGIAHDLTPDLVAYGEVGYAFYASGGAEPWEVQFGTEYAPASVGCACAAPFLAVNAHLREEADFGGNLNVIAGWEWRSGSADRLFRLGAQYSRGRSSQYAFAPRHEELFGLLVGFDY